MATPVLEEPVHDKGGVVDWKTWTGSQITAQRQTFEVELEKRDQAIAHLTELLERLLRERDKALVLAIQEVERRLDHLNGAQEKAERDRSEFATKDTIEPRLEANMARVGQLELQLQSLLPREVFDEFRSTVSETNLKRVAYVDVELGKLVRREVFDEFRATVNETNLKRVAYVDVEIGKMLRREVFDEFKTTQSKADTLLAVSLTEMKAAILAATTMRSVIIQLVGSILVGLALRFLAR